MWTVHSLDGPRPRIARLSHARRASGSGSASVRCRGGPAIRTRLLSRHHGLALGQQLIERPRALIRQRDHVRLGAEARAAIEGREIDLLAHALAEVLMRLGELFVTSAAQ